MENYIVLDFETRSAADLPKCGAYVYASHPTTEIICLGYSLNGAEAKLWRPDRDGPHMPDDLFEYITEDVDVIAHNATFERAIWERIMVPDYGWIDILDGQWYDTIASCAYKAIPLALSKACKALELVQQKGGITKKYFSPDKKTGAFLDVPEEMYEYCKQDVRTQNALYARLGRVSKREEKVWQLDQIINRRGIRIDMDFVRSARKIVREEATPLIAEFRKLTGAELIDGELIGGVNPTQRDKVIGWAADYGVILPNLQKDMIDELLGYSDESDDAGYVSKAGSDDASETIHEAALPVEVRRALTIRRIVGSASVKKLNSLLLCTDGDFRVRGALQYHGASTGRWSGRLLQPHNFPRGTVKVFVGTDKKGEKKYASPDPETVVSLIKQGDYKLLSSLYGTSATEVISSALRHAIIPEEGSQLVVGDFSTIEARIVLAIAGQTDKVKFLAAGGPIYEAMAEEIYGYPVNKEDHPVERQTGKNAVLGLGFQMGWKKFRFRYAPEMDEDFAKGVVQIYREDFAPQVPKLWAGLEAASLDTVITGRSHESHGIVYRLEDGFMTCQLPSKRKLWYYSPRFIKKPMPWDPHDIRPAWDYLSYKKGCLVRVDAYGGLETENVVSGTARDLLVSAMFRAEREGYPIVLTVHDELVCELENVLNPSADVLQEIMNYEPEWARGLNIPIASECWQGVMYKK